MDIWKQAFLDSYANRINIEQNRTSNSKKKDSYETNYKLDCVLPVDKKEKNKIPIPNSVKLN